MSATAFDAHAETQRPKPHPKAQLEIDQLRDELGDLAGRLLDLFCSGSRNQRRNTGRETSRIHEFLDRLQITGGHDACPVERLLGGRRTDGKSIPLRDLRQAHAAISKLVTGEEKARQTRTSRRPRTSS